ncbi:TIGR02391 family protein [Streptomyces sp. NBC_01298]|uniref:TIGR02391 family protein n=1 Tax=Streptomyces sp. NBC_01298 TaxID=2903817 RepID=UPI002E12616E|nr:TIGR02391 family protein [Streptomyces sp. NBC_01298]
MIVRTIAPEGMPRPTGQDGHALLDVVWQHFSTSLRWPTFDYVDRKLYASGLQFEEAIQQLCPALLRGVDADLRRLPQGMAELSLTIAGAANCANSETRVNSFLVLLRTAADIEPHFQPTDPGALPELRPVDLAPPVDDPELALKTRRSWFAGFALALQEPCFRGGGHSLDNLDWTLRYARDIRPFANVHRVDEYWRIREQVLGRRRVEADNTPFQKGPNRHFAPAPKAKPVPRAAESVEVTCMLHPLIAEVAAERYSSGFYYDAVRSAFQAVEHRVAVLVGTTEVGERLMGIAFGAKPHPPKIMVTRSMGGSLESEQNGMQFLFKGAMGALRNPRMHGPDEKDARDEADEMLIFASFLMRRLDIEDEQRKSASLGP